MQTIPQRQVKLKNTNSLSWNYKLPWWAQILSLPLPLHSGKSQRYYQQALQLCESICILTLSAI